ncbi:alpha-L-arabinofuranosidase C-terminal domain-containing protein [Salinisphaera sp.]|uniref:alpha-L-arabinofuranosidase C-terminal domain-containing protein n=1 Tax=Salinisphaera sp. TaxID=1914330 RepID=UPI002D782D60|nr:alpha-L-arabinofuranosidase C-terminal domain-containing protein [Salinisphaera sp.]HET7314175.1 alpha-L-arabinofuranosidase C-terminal domain-containing protein [Salinisphaera sp.]
MSYQDNDRSPGAARFTRRDFLKTTGLGVSGAALWAIAARTGLAGTGQMAGRPAIAETWTVNAGQPGPTIPSTLYGLFFEDINYSGVGGLYAELLRNRGFNEDPDRPVHWSAVAGQSSAARIALDRNVPFNDAHPKSLRLDIVDGGERVGVANEGYWGIPVSPGSDGDRRINEYTVRLFARASNGYRGGLRLTVESLDGSRVYASGRINRIGNRWRGYTAMMSVDAGAPDTMDARFVITADDGDAAGQSIWFGWVSLFPPTYNDRPNGNRPDLMEKLVAMRPGIFRFPGGNYLEGQTIATRFDWEKTIGPPWQRPGHQNTAWGYWSDDGLGLLEFLEMTEDMSTVPVLGVWAGYTLNGTVVPEYQLGEYVQSALNEIEYVVGSTNTTWGAKRAADGHPEPFDLKYVEVGNEDFFDESGSYDQYRFPMFYDAIKRYYPDIQVIATQPVTTRQPDIVDDHFYSNPQFFVNNAHRYDDRAADKPKVFVGEYGVTTEGQPPTGTLSGAVGEAAFMTGFERNADTVIMSAYAPLLARVGHSQWPTNLIGFDGLSSFGSPSYYVQRLFSRNVGDAVLPIDRPGQSRRIEAETDRWYQLVGVYDRDAGETRLYVDGVLQDRQPYADSDAWRADGDFAIGRGLFGGNPVDFVDGAIDDVRVYDRALADDAAADPGTDGLVAWWRFDAGSGSTAADSADGHTGTLEGGAGWGDGRGPASLALDGSGQYVEIDGPVIDTSQSFSVAAYVRFNDVGGYRTIASVDGNAVSAFFLQKRDDGGFAFTRLPADSTAANADAVIASSLNADDLQVVASRDSETGRIYIKAANADSKPRSVSVRLDDVHAPAFSATVTTLTGEPDAQNTIDNPDNVAPRQRTTTLNREFDYEFPEQSVTVLALDVGNG